MQLRLHTDAAQPTTSYASLQQPALPVEGHVSKDVELVPSNGRRQVLLHLLGCCAGR